MSHHSAAAVITGIMRYVLQTESRLLNKLSEIDGLSICGENIDNGVSNNQMKRYLGDNLCKQLDGNRQNSFNSVYGNQESLQLQCDTPFRGLLRSKSSLNYGNGACRSALLQTDTRIKTFGQFGKNGNCRKTVSDHLPRSPSDYNVNLNCEESCESSDEDPYEAGELAPSHIDDHHLNSQSSCFTVVSRTSSPDRFACVTSSDSSTQNASLNKIDMSDETHTKEPECETSKIRSTLHYFDDCISCEHSFDYALCPACCCIRCPESGDKSTSNCSSYNRVGGYVNDFIRSDINTTQQRKIYTNSNSTNNSTVDATAASNQSANIDANGTISDISICVVLILLQFIVFIAVYNYLFFGTLYY